MQTDQMILAQTFCNHYSIEISFVEMLSQMGLVQLTSIEEQSYIPFDELPRLEQLKSLHFDLDINLQDMDIVCNLLEKMQQLSQENAFLRNKLTFYESAAFNSAQPTNVGS